MSEIRGFSKVLGRKVLFRKKIVPSSRAFIAVLVSHHTYIYVPLPVEACSPNELAVPFAAAFTPALLEISD